MLKSGSGERDVSRAAALLHSVRVRAPHIEPTAYLAVEAMWEGPFQSAETVTASAGTMIRERHFLKVEYATICAKPLDQGGTNLLPERLSVSSDGSWRMAERAQKGTTHSFPVCKARFSRHHVDRMCTLLQHQPCRLDAKIFNGFCR
jgi:hypothetical protein